LAFSAIARYPGERGGNSEAFAKLDNSDLVAKGSEAQSGYAAGHKANVEISAKSLSKSTT
jgi:hypothetical protein